MRKLDLKLTVGLVLISVILTSAIWYVWAATPTTTIWISPGIYPGAPSYTIWREGSNYFAKDATGQIDYSGTNASDVINSALDNGKSVFLTNAIYRTTHTIALNAGNELLGEGYDTVIKPVDNCDIQAAMGVIQNKGRFFAPSTSDNNTRIANLRVDGNNDSQTTAFEGIAIGYSYGCTIENVWVHNSPEIGISIAVGSVDIINSKSYLNEADGLQLDFGASNLVGGSFRVYGGRYHHNEGAGIKFHAGVNNWIEPASFTVSLTEVDNNGEGGIIASFATGNVEKVVFANNHVHDNVNDGIAFAGGTISSDYGIIIGNVVENNDFCGIKLWVVNGTTVQDNIVRNNVQVSGGANNYEAGIYVYQSNNVMISGNIVMDDQTPKTQRFGMRLNEGVTSSENITASFNIVTGNKEGDFYFENSITNLTVTGNIGLVTENHGISSVATGATVAHGLSGTPTGIQVTAGEAGPTDIYLTAIGSSTFTINFGGGGTKQFCWCAKYAP